MYNRLFKRLLDILFSLIFIVIAALPMIIIALAVKVDSRGKVIFTQKRAGIATAKRKYFNIYKFRTMYSDTPDNVPTHLLNSRDAHITRVGRVLRKTSLDELPQLFNILKGDMSFVGPRPALYNQYDLLLEREKNGSDGVLPGLTGWAQVNGRDGIDLYEKARLDGEYFDKISFGFDVKCILLTLKLLTFSKDPEYESANGNEVLK